MFKTIICTICPLSCEIRLEVDQNGEIISLSGNRCRRGETYAIKEHTAPQRTLTTTIKIKGGIHPLLPVRTDAPIPKEKLQEGMLASSVLEVKAPLKMGQVLVEDFLDLGVNLIATRDLPAFNGPAEG